MGIGAKFKAGVKWVKETRRTKRELYEKKKQLLQPLRMNELKKLAEEYNIEIKPRIPLLNDKPIIKDYVETLSGSRFLPLEHLERYVREIHEAVVGKKQKDYEINVAGNFIMKNSSLTGDVNIGNILSNFSSKVINAKIDSNLRMEALKKIAELREEIERPNPDKTRIEKIIQWFTKNKKELVQVVMPFIERLILALNL